MSELSTIFNHKHPNKYINISKEDNTISFKIQEGPIKEVGVNGCQVDDMIQVSRTIIESLNQNYSCRENSLVMTKLDEALLWLSARKNDRLKRGVEGYNKE